MRVFALVLTLMAAVAGVLIVWGTGHPLQDSPPACETRESVLETRYRDYGPTAVVVSHPCSDAPDRPFVVFTSYIALVDGDYYTGQDPSRALLTPRTSQYFLFRWLARALAKHGVASVRYDPIAIRSRQPGEEGFSRATVVEEDLLRVQRSDFSGLLSQVISQASKELGRTADAPVVLVSHSGGSFTVADYLDIEAARGLSRAYGFVGVSGWVDTPARITEQTKWRYWSTKLESCLGTSDAKYCLRQWQVIPQYGESFIDQEVRSRIEALFSLGLTKSDLLKQVDAELSALSERVTQARLAGMDGQSLLNGVYRINRRVLHDLHFGPANAKPISCRASASALIYGEEDFVLDPRSQVQAWTGACGQHTDVTVLPKLGHALGQDPYFGPPDPAAVEIVKSAILSVASQLASTQRRPHSSIAAQPPSPSSPPPPTGVRR